MKKIIVIYFLFFLIYPHVSFSQSKQWKNFRWEAIYGIGASNFLGDFGGSNGTDRRFLNDLNIQSTRPAIIVGTLYKIQPKIYLKLNLLFGWVTGDDALTKDPARSKRNLNFRSPIFEQSIQLEYSLIGEKYGLRYSFSNAKKFSFANINTYLFAGAGGLYFNPKVNPTRTRGKWAKPTAQGKTSRGEQYTHYQAVFPVGIGFKYGINRRLCFNVEFTERFTTTDYIDNHSDKFTKKKDMYMFILFTLNYRLKTKSKQFLPLIKWNNIGSRLSGNKM